LGDKVVTRFKLKNLTVVLAMSLAPLSASQAQEAIAPAIVAQASALRDSAFEKNKAWDILESLTTEIGPRLAGSPAEARARVWAVGKMQALGFANVRVMPFEIPLWIRGVEEARVLAPFAQPLVITALGDSGATPPEGLEAQVVAFTSLKALQAADPAQVRGRIIFITHEMRPTQDGESYGVYAAIRRMGPAVAARKGAVAILIRSIGTDQDRLPHTGQTSWEEGQAPIAAAALSVPDAILLERIFARGKPVRIALRLTPKRMGTGMSGNVVGEIPGQGPNPEIVTIGGHLDSWDLGTGAIDDGAGLAITMAAAKLIADSGRKPLRTIRVVAWGAEEIGVLGGAAYASATAHQPHSVAAESDFGAGKIWRFGLKAGAEANPAREALSEVLRPLGIFEARNKVSGGPDVQPLSDLGISILELKQDGSDYFDLHHTANDTLDKVNPAALDQNVAAWAAAIWVLANAPQSLGKPVSGANNH